MSVHINGSRGNAKGCSGVTVLLCTYKPSTYFSEQLESIAHQVLRPSSIWVSDDTGTSGSVDFIRLELKAAGLRAPQVVCGPRNGFAANFLSLLCNPDVTGQFFAFSDQDDIWMPDKLKTAVDRLARVEDGKPAFYCGRTLLVTENNEELGYSPLFRRRPTFSNALVQSIAGGNTMVLNRAAKELITRAGVRDIVSHDWWIYLLVSGAGGEVIYDEVPTIRYRQHDGNLVGGHTSWLAHLRRIKLLLFHDRFKHWNHIHVDSLDKVRHLLTSENCEKLDWFSAARRGRGFTRLKRLRKAGVYRQTQMGNLGLSIATLTGKI